MHPTRRAVAVLVALAGVVAYSTATVNSSPSSAPNTPPGRKPEPLERLADDIFEIFEETTQLLSSPSLSSSPYSASTSTHRSPLSAAAAAFAAPLWRRVASNLAAPLGGIRAEAMETESSYTIRCDLPGLAREEMCITITEGVLAITAQRKPLHPSTPLQQQQQNEETDGSSESDDECVGDDSCNDSGTGDGGDATTDTSTSGTGVKLFFSEVPYGKLHRSFKLPPDADVDSINAKLADGVLTITLRKRDLPKPRSVDVQ